MTPDLPETLLFGDTASTRCSAKAQTRILATRHSSSRFNATTRKSGIILISLCSLTVVACTHIDPKSVRNDTTTETKSQRILAGFVPIAAGRFRQGSNSHHAPEDEKPVRVVSVPAFQMSKTEVTFTQYDQYVREKGLTFPDDQGWGRSDRPVINISWQEAAEYAAWFGSQQPDFDCSLPTESEWEYAARANSTTEWPWGNENSEAKASEYAVFNANKTSPVKSKSKNGFGLYDMFGNVWEWVQDCYSENYSKATNDGSAIVGEASCRRVLRGGTFYSSVFNLRASNRNRNYEDFRFNGIGFRVSCRPS